MENINFKNSITRDIFSFHKQLEDEVVASLKKLGRQNFLHSIGSIFLNWIVIGLSIFSVYKISLIFLPISLFFIGSRQRALSNLVHDGSHGNLFKNKKLNDFLVNLLAAWPMNDSVSDYRKSHRNHHSYLGNKILDPDLENHRRYGFNDFNPPKAQALKTYLSLLFNLESWKDSVLGSKKLFSSTEIIPRLAFCLFLATIIASISPLLLFYSAGLWIISRMTCYHGIRIFAEFMDHSGLSPGSVTGYTRNIPGASRSLAFILHPHADNFHLVHHLLPQIPHYRLKEAHEVLLKNRYYRELYHCDGYFLGQFSALDSWAQIKRSS